MGPRRTAGPAAAVPASPARHGAAQTQRGDVDESSPITVVDTRALSQMS
jgi:hypothetical protein